MPSTAIAVSANTAAVVAASNARAARDDACYAMLTSFDSAGSTPEGRRAYVECVERVEPLPRTPESEHNDKVLVGGLLIAAVIGAIIGYAKNERYGDGGISALGAVCGAFIVPLGVVLIIAFVELLGWIVS